MFRCFGNDQVEPVCVYFDSFTAKVGLGFRGGQRGSEGLQVRRLDLQRSAILQHAQRLADALHVAWRWVDQQIDIGGGSLVAVEDHGKAADHRVSGSVLVEAPGDSLVDVGGKLPLVVQFVDTEDQVSRVLPLLREMAPERLITIQEVEIVAPAV